MRFFSTPPRRRVAHVATLLRGFCAGRLQRAGLASGVSQVERLMNRREILQAGFGALSATALTPRDALAQAKFPERPIRLMIPFSAGGVTDIVGRHWAERMKGPL